MPLCRCSETDRPDESDSCHRALRWSVSSSSKPTRRSRTWSRSLAKRSTSAASLPLSAQAVLSNDGLIMPGPTDQFNRLRLSWRFRFRLVPEIFLRTSLAAAEGVALERDRLIIPPVDRCINAMFIDATALAERVTDDVITSPHQRKRPCQSHSRRSSTLRGRGFSGAGPGRRPHQLLDFASDRLRCDSR
jgi:hypothetical protein